MNDDKDIKMPNFLIDLAFKNYIKVLSDAQAGRLFKALLDYADGVKIDENKLNPNTKITFEALKSTIDKGKEKYTKKVLRNRAIGRKRKEANENQTETKRNPNGNQMETIGAQIKQNKSKVLSKDNTLRLSASSAGSPDGQPAPKPEYCELRSFYKEQSGYDDAYFCDEFQNKIEESGNDWRDWQRKMLDYAVETGKLSYE